MISRFGNMRPFPLVLAENITGKQAYQWLCDQSKDVRRVTYINPHGVLMQRPAIDNQAFVDPTAILIGGIIISPGCYVGPYAVVRMDENHEPEPLVLGEHSNIQDGAIIHCVTSKIGKRVIVAHQAIVHGAVVEDDVTIYIQAVADGDGTVIGKGSFLDQGSYVGKNIQIPPGRHVPPGTKVITQEAADKLPMVSDKLKKICAKVLELNSLHTQRYLELGK
jgi:carbonic anhydrase/acetyltransferase-like protein (isoleucine patch superfamily)